MEIRKATRQKSKLRLGISGPSGSGKTFSALRIAAGITTWDKVAVIDTENGRADLYAHMPTKYPDIEGGSEPYNIIRLGAPFSPERYIDAIRTCEDSGIEIIIIDSISHEWEGKGGILQINELIAQTKFKGNTWAAWSQTTPRHQAFIESIIDSSCHIITTARAKVETVQSETGKVKKIGVKEIQREGYEYELTVNFTLDREAHMATASKDNTELFEGLDPFLITETTGRQLKEWCESGVTPLVKVKTEKPEITATNLNGERPHLDKLKKELVKRGAKSPSEALIMLNELTSSEFERFAMLTEKEASTAMAKLLMKDLEVSPKK